MPKQLTKEYINLNDSTIKENEIVLWEGTAQTMKKRLVHIIIIMIIGVIIAFIYAINNPSDVYIAIGLSIFMILLSAFVYLIANKIHGKDYAIITNKKLIIRNTIYYYFTYDEVYEAVEKRGLVDRILKSSTIVVKVLHTRANNDTGKVISQRVGKITIDAIIDAEGFMAALEGVFKVNKLNKNKN